MTLRHKSYRRNDVALLLLPPLLLLLPPLLLLQPMLPLLPLLPLLLLLLTGAFTQLHVLILHLREL